MSYYPSPVIISDANFQTLKSRINRYKMKYCLCVYSMAKCIESSYQVMFSKENKLECSTSIPHDRTTLCNLP